MLRIEKYNYDQIAEHYPAIHNQVFDKVDPKHVPAIIYLGFEGEDYIGFMSVYYHDAVTYYVQRIGIPNSLRGKHLAHKFFIDVMAHVKNEGIKYMLGHVENINTPTLLVALHSGWIINGVHTDTAGKTYIRILKEL